MAKPVLKFTAVAYDVNGHKGYRPQLEQQNPVSDLDFCREVVTEKRLSMSAEELLHALEMVGEVGPKKVAEDGRPRAVTKLLKWNRYAQGNLESPTSPWNASCKAVIRAQLLFDADARVHVLERRVDGLLDRVHDDGSGHEDGKIALGNAVVFEGLNLEGAAMKLDYTDVNSGEAASETFAPERATYSEGVLKFNEGIWSDLMADTDKPAKVTLTTAAGSDSRDVTFRHL